MPGNHSSDEEEGTQPYRELLRSGNVDDAFDGLFDHFHPRSVRFVASRIRNLADADDLVQEGTMRLYAAHIKGVRLYDPNRPFWPYLRTYLLHESIDYLRKGKRTRNFESLDDEASPREIASEELTVLAMLTREPNKEDLEPYLDECLESLEPKHTEVLRLSFFQQMKGKEIARHLKIAASTVSYRKETAVKELRASLLTKFEQERR